jgi:hypothetical protein
LKLPRRRRLVIGLAILVPLVAAVAIAAAIAGGWLLNDTATPTSIQDVLQRFHQGARGAGDIDGVYLYATRGDESVDALGGAHHRYPKTSTITVVTEPCGMRLLWEPLEERSATWTLCATPRGIELSGWEVVHEFFGQRDSTTYACTESVIVPAEQTPTVTNTLRCSSESGHQTGETRLVGVEEIAVAGTRLRAVHARTAGRVSGGDEGTETTDWWLDERSGLPLRIGLSSRTSRSILIGEVHYREDADLRLRSIKPLR